MSRSNNLQIRLTTYSAVAMLGFVKGEHMTTYTFHTALLSDDADTPRAWTFFLRGDYVYFTDEHGRDRQVCRRLYTFGDTLTASPDTLPQVIRRHARLRRYDEAQRARNPRWRGVR
jgi:hypothetical protein